LCDIWVAHLQVRKADSKICLSVHLIEVEISMVRSSYLLCNCISVYIFVLHIVVGYDMIVIAYSLMTNLTIWVDNSIKLYMCDLKWNSSIHSLIRLAFYKLYSDYYTMAKEIWSSVKLDY
jgi:hypothetical protein